MFAGSSGHQAWDPIRAGLDRVFRVGMLVEGFQASGFGLQLNPKAPKPQTPNPKP